MNHISDWFKYYKRVYDSPHLEPFLYNKLKHTYTRSILTLVGIAMINLDGLAGGGIRIP